jgi:DNA-binding GntR family transcriptional regulator
MSLAIPKINRHKSSIGHQHRAIFSQLPARLNLRQGQPSPPHGHLRVLDALRRRDSAAARRAIVDDIVSGGASLMSRMSD